MHILKMWLQFCNLAYIFLNVCIYNIYIVNYFKLAIRHRNPNYTFFENCIAVCRKCVRDALYNILQRYEVHRL